MSEEGGCRKFLKTKCIRSKAQEFEYRRFTISFIETSRNQLSINPYAKFWLIKKINKQIGIEGVSARLVGIILDVIRGR